MSNYITCAYKIPKGTITSLISKQPAFWWGKTDAKFCRLKSWGKVCQLKVSRGLEIRDSFIMSKALLSKVAWRIMLCPQSLLSQILKAKYERGKCWSNLAKSNNSSNHWKSIFKSIESIKDDVCWSVGDGKTIRLGIDQ